MDKRIAVLCTSEMIAAKVLRLFGEWGHAYPVTVSTFDRIHLDAQKAIEEGAQVFISRGRSADLLKRRFDLPLVPLRFTYYDFVVALQEARCCSDRLAIIGYEGSWFHSLERYRSILADPYTVYLSSSGELGAAVRRLKAEGVEVVVGGQTASRMAERHGLRAVCIGLEDSSVLDSVEEAQHLLHISQLHNAHIATVAAILDSAAEGIVAVDALGAITKLNNSARQLMGEDALGRDLSAYLPRGVLEQALRGGRSLGNALIEISGVPCTVSSSPIVVERAVSGTVFTIQQVRQVQRLEQNIRKQQAETGNTARSTFEDIIHVSPVMRDTISLARQYAASGGTILIQGETGTGKEMFAQSIHNHSARAPGPFVAINCAALPQNILESELFGYVKGAFTGASAKGKEGYFEMAHTGTIFLDEIGEIPMDMQLKLLRVLQEREVRRIGDHKVFHVDVRVIAASNRELSQLVRQGLFREDLYYRLAVLELRIPPLRNRREDVAPLARAILAELAGREQGPPKRLEPEAERMLSSLDWLGNVRQVRNVAERLYILTRGESIGEGAVRRAVYAGEAPAAQAQRQPAKSMSRAEMRMVAEALRAERGNRGRAAERLGISTTTLWRKLCRIREQDPDFLDEHIYGAGV